MLTIKARMPARSDLDANQQYYQADFAAAYRNGGRGVRHGNTQVAP